MIRGEEGLKVFHGYIPARYIITVYGRVQQCLCAIFSSETLSAAHKQPAYIINTSFRMTQTESHDFA